MIWLTWVALIFKLRELGFNMFQPLILFRVVLTNRWQHRHQFILNGSLTVWALYAYFSGSQNVAFELLVWYMLYQCNRWIKWQEPASKIFSKFLRTRELWRVDRGGGMKFNENKKCFKKWFLHVFLIYLVGMVISIEHIICRVLPNHDNWWNCFKNKICFVIKWFWGGNLEVTCIFLTTCTVNNTKPKAQQKK